MSDWEAQDTKRALQLLVGDYFGDHPEEKLDEIRMAKKDRAAHLCKMMGCNEESVVLEIGSGMGFTSKFVAKKIKRLICSDISQSFLDLARKECSDVPNIEFIRIEIEPATFSFQDEFFDFIFSDAVFIHLNLFDIYWYFSEFQRLLKTGGIVFINIKNASNIDLEKFSQMANYYRQNRDSLKRLLCWNSPDAVIAIAENFGFKLKSKGRFWWLKQGTTIDLLFSKQ